MLQRPSLGDGKGPPRVLTARLCVFCSDETKSTSWVHPSTGYAIQSGHFSCAGKGRSHGSASALCPPPTPSAIWSCGVKSSRNTMGTPKSWASRSCLAAGGVRGLQMVLHLLGMGFAAGDVFSEGF